MKIPRKETCREWDENAFNYCGRPAAVIIWGKLFPDPALGPKCEKHAIDHCKGRPLNEIVHNWAIYDLRPVNALHEERR